MKAIIRSPSGRETEWSSVRAAIHCLDTMFDGLAGVDNKKIVKDLDEGKLPYFHYNGWGVLPLTTTAKKGRKVEVYYPSTGQRQNFNSIKHCCDVLNQNRTDVKHYLENPFQVFSGRQYRYV